MDDRTLCKYGAKCYQKNPNHKRMFKHLEEGHGDTVELDPPNKKEKIKQLDTPQEATNDKDELLPSKDPVSLFSTQNLREIFLVEMPKDFYDLWKYCKNENPERPEDAFQSAGLKLCGPIDLLSGKIDQSSDSSAFLCHWRYYYDPPEFQTVIAGNENEYHIGYYRDVPRDRPVFVASMSNIKPGTIFSMGDNLFSAVTSFLKSCSKERDIFNKNNIQLLIESIGKFSQQNNYDLDSTTAAIKSRSKKVVAKTFHGAGIVVPVCKETDVGYREIPETNATLKKMFKKIIDSSDLTRESNFEALHELMTQVQFANDEGDFGMGLELALDLFTYGGEEFHSIILHLLTVSYELLDRNEFTKILMAHLDDRRKGSEMSRFER